NRTMRLPDTPRAPTTSAGFVEVLGRRKRIVCEPFRSLFSSTGAFLPDAFFLFLQQPVYLPGEFDQLVAVCLHGRFRAQFLPALTVLFVHVYPTKHANCRKYEPAHDHSQSK